MQPNFLKSFPERKGRNPAAGCPGLGTDPAWVSSKKEKEQPACSQEKNGPEEEGAFWASFLRKVFSRNAFIKAKLPKLEKNFKAISGKQL